MRTPLVVVDADVLGRRRTGDETYVANLLRAPGAARAPAGLRLAAVTRRPELVPDGIEPLALATPVQELRMAWTLPRLLRRVGAALVHTQYALPLRSPCPAVVTDPRPLVRGRHADAVEGPARLPRVVPRAGAARARVLTVSRADEARPRRALRRGRRSGSS